MKKLIIILLFALIFSSCSEQKEVKNEVYYKTWSVVNWNLNSQESFIWYTDSFTKADFWAKVWWKITKINFWEWNYVKSWDLLATLDSTEAKSSFNSTNDVISSLSDLKQKTSNMYDEQIKASKAKIDQINTNLEIADLQISWTNSANSDTKNITQNQLKTIETQIDQAKTSLETANLNLENTKSNLSQKEDIIYSNSKNSISNSIILWNNIIDFLDNLFWVTQKNKTKNDLFEIYLWAKDTKNKDLVEKEISDLILKFESIKTDFNNLNWKEDSKNLLNKANNLFSNEFRIVLKNSYKVLEDSVSTTTLTDTNITTYKTQISSFQSQNEQIILNVSWNYIVWLKWSLDSIDNFNKESKSNTDLLQKQVELAQKQLDVLNQTYNQYSSIWDWQINDVGTKLEVIKKQKDTLNNQLNELNLNINALNEQKSAKLQEIDTQISQTKSSLKNSWVMIDNWKIYSSISWIVTKKYVEVWQIVWSWTPILSVSENSDIKININIWDEELKSIKLNDEVWVSIDWISENLKWYIKNILPTKDKITKKTTIEISLKNIDKKISIWSFSKVYLKDNSSSGLIISNSSIINQYMQPWVFVLDKSKIQFKNIKIISSDNNSSIIQWLNSWEIIITEWKQNLFDWQQIN